MSVITTLDLYFCLALQIGSGVIEAFHRTFLCSLLALKQHTTLYFDEEETLGVIPLIFSICDSVCMKGKERERERS